MTRFIEKYSDKLVANKIIQSEDEELYVYGLQQGLLIIVNIITTIIIGFIFGMIWQSILFMVVYIPLRQNAGGYHARTQLRCYIFSLGLTTMILSVLKFVSLNNFIILGVSLAAGLIIFFLAPVEDTNKPLDETETTIYKKRTRIILIIELCIVVVFLLMSIIETSACIAISLLALSFMLLIGKLKNISNAKLVK